jgi:hypothetical protein
MHGVISSSSALPIDHQTLSSHHSAGQNVREESSPPVSDNFLAALLKEKDVAEKLEIVKGLRFEENENTKLNLGDELFHVKAPDGTRFTVAGQRSADNPAHIHVRIPHTEELTRFTLQQGDRDADWEFIYTLPEYHFSSDNRLVLHSSAEAQRLESKDYGAFVDEEAYYSQPISQEELKKLLPPQEAKKAPNANQFDFPRRELVPSESMKSGVAAQSHAEQNAIADESELQEKLERLDIQGARHFARGVRKQGPLGGVGARQASPTPSELSKVEVDLGACASSDTDSEAGDAGGDKNAPATYTPASLALLKKYGLTPGKDGSVKLPGTKFEEYRNPRETNRFNASFGDAVLASLLGASSGTIQAVSRNPLVNLSTSFAALNEKLFNQSEIHIVSAGAGLTAVGTALYTVFEPNGNLKQRNMPLDGSDSTQPTYKFTFIDPAGDFGGLAYQVGKGCLGGAASRATKTNTPVSHLQLGVLGFSFRDFLMEKIKTLKADEKEKARADLELGKSNKSLSRIFSRVGKMGNTLADTIRSVNNPSDLEKAETLLRLNFDLAAANRIDKMRVRFSNYANFQFFTASAKDKPNSRKFWVGQGERELVCEYGKWVINKMRNAGIEMNFVKGNVTACEVDDKLNAIYTYTDYDEKGAERKTTIKGDLGMISIGQGPLRAPPQVKHLPQETILTYDELMPDAQNVADLVAKHPGPLADEAVRTYGEKWLGLKLGILGTGIAFEEVEPVLETMTKICRQYEEERGLKLLPDREMDFFENRSFAFSRNGLTHELKREDTFFLRFGFSPEKVGKSTALHLEKIMTEKEVEYRTRLGEIFKEGQTVDVVKEFQKIVDEIKNTPNQTRKEKALLDACLTLALHKTGNAIAAGLDDLGKDEFDHPWRSDIHECLLRLNKEFLSYLEKSIVPTSNANVDRTNRMHKYGRIIAAGADYRLNVGKDKKIVLTHKDGEEKGIDKVVICGGRKNYDKTGRDGGIKFPQTATLGSAEDPSLQSMEVEVGFFPKSPEGPVLPFIMATSAWMPLAALTGSNSLYGAKGTLAAYKDSAKVSLGRSAESGAVAGALINIKLNDDTAKLNLSRLPGDESESDLDSDEFDELVETGFKPT